jgi:hypothetical protein
MDLDGTAGPGTWGSRPSDMCRAESLQAVHAERERERLYNVSGINNCMMQLSRVPTSR